MSSAEANEAAPQAGCTAGGPATRKEVRDLIQRLEDIDHRLGGSGGVNLPSAVAAAMGPAPRKRR